MPTGSTGSKVGQSADVDGSRAARRFSPVPHVFVEADGLSPPKLGPQKCANFHHFFLLVGRETPY